MYLDIETSYIKNRSKFLNVNILYKAEFYFRCGKMDCRWHGIWNSPRRKKINAATRNISRFATKNINLFLLKYYEERNQENTKRVRTQIRLQLHPLLTISKLHKLALYTLVVYRKERREGGQRERARSNNLFLYRLTE